MCRRVSRRISNLPRSISPELIEPGDTIEVEYPASDGITITMRGTVAFVQYNAGNRYIITQEGATLNVWRPGTKTGVKYTIIDRAPMATPMLDMFTESGRL